MDVCNSSIHIKGEPKLWRLYYQNPKYLLLDLPLNIYIVLVSRIRKVTGINYNQKE